ncbi:di-heme oxidoredictase family protein [Leptolyngbya sp. BC1307]|uniref:di-heme oxidoreductase family protein n=1 Tax=Leptolyngbya sp. BC1307 TaxID=2029589 RepID=UPI000EFD9A3E|nr:di-heme oxidoredictase family protein [Leptolyngbya sp. BC1307]
MASSSSRPSRLLGYLLLFAAAIAVAALLSISLKQGTTPTPNYQAGGETTFYNRSSHAFGQPAPGLNAQEMDLHAEGDVAFDAVFVTAPAPIHPGLGPTFNNNSCAGCHIKNGRGMPQLGQALVRTSLPASSDRPIVKTEGVVPDPVIGTQLQDSGVYGVQPEASVTLEWQEMSGQYPDGEGYELRSPQITLSAIDNNSPISEDLLTSLRIPPPIFGVGLLEAIPERTLKKLSDPEDKNNDGISGRTNHVWNFEQQRMDVGRFGLKANSANLLSQTATAYAHDMGIANPLLPNDDGTTEIDADTLEASAFYTQTLAVPARTQVDNPIVQRGEKLFADANCAACHLTSIQTGSATVKALAHQTIQPYTDLLLHDMGEALADNRPDFEATGQEWRTAPLWGLGLTQTVLPYSGYLHDGRARTVEEAILWHGGEAENAKQAFMALSKEGRAAMLKFLNSL